MNETELSLLDRCDRCGSQAFARATFDAGELLFCGHHFNKYKLALESQAIWIHEELEKLVKV